MQVGVWLRSTAALALAGVSFAGSAQAQVAHRPGTSQEVQAIEQTLRLMSWELQDLPAPRIPQDGGFDVLVRHEGVVYLLDLQPWWAMRSRTPVVYGVGADGVWTEYPAPPPISFKGDVIDTRTGAVVGTAFAAAENGEPLHATVRMSLDGSRWHVQPLGDALPGAPTRRHVVYREDDVLPAPGACGADLLPDGARGSTYRPPAGDGAAPEAPGDKVTEIGIEIDNPFYVWAGGTRKSAVRSVEKVMIDVNAIYSADVGIIFVPTFYVVRQTSPDPYTTNDAALLLGQFQSEWNSKKAALPRDVAHMFTARNLIGGVIGIANLSTVCTVTSAYGLSQSSFSTNDAQRAALTAHEIGHTYSATHCDAQGDCRIMCSVLGQCSGIINSFGPTEVGQIVNFKNSRSCLTTAGTAPTFPLFDNFESGILGYWLWNYGATIDTTAANEPSGTSSLLVNAKGSGAYDDDFIRTDDWAQAESASSINISFWLEITGVEAGEELKLGGYKQGKNWNNLLTVTHDGVNQSAFSFFSVPITDPAYFHKFFKFRFNAESNETNDHFFIDDLSVTMTAGLTVAGGDDDGQGGIRPLRFTVVGGEPGQTVILYAGFDDLVKSKFDPHKGFQLDLAGKAYPIAQFRTNHQGMGLVELPVPAGLGSASFWTQALVLGSEPEGTPPQQVVLKP